MPRHALLVPLAAASIVLAGCSATTSQHEAATTSPITSSSQQTSQRSTKPPESTSSSTSSSASDNQASLKIPTDLAGGTLGDAKKRLDEVGFTNVVTSGRGLTDEDAVADVPKAGETVAPDTQIVLVGEPSESKEQPQQPRERQQPDADTSPGCGERAVDEGKFDPECDEYQGYLDPGTAAGRDPTSGEIQRQYGCEEGYIPQSECPG